ncbi:MAG: lipopolysaccharide biosynthesis protein [Sciscionella sp.]
MDTTPLAAQPRHAKPHRIWWGDHRTLLSTTASLMGTTGITTVLGVVFWWLAAQLVPVAAVGYGSAAVSAMMLVGTFGMAGLNTVLIGQLARHPDNAGGLLAASLYASTLISAVLAGGFLLIATVLLPHVAPYLADPEQSAIFVVGSGITGATLVLDEALIGLLFGSVQLWRNAVFAVAKLAALAGLAVVLHERMGTGILEAWTVGTLVSALPVAVLLRRRGMRMMAAPQWKALRNLGRSSLNNTWLNNALQAPRLALPMIVTGLVSATASGAFYVAWTIVVITSLIPHHFTTALYAVGSADPRGLAAKLRVTLRISMLGGLLGVPLLIVIAHPLLQLFGSAYASDATTPMQILLLGYFGSVVKNHYIALCRVHEQITRAARYATVTCVARLAGTATGALLDGLRGLSIALLIVMCAEGIAVLPAVWAAAREKGRRPHPRESQHRRPRRPDTATSNNNEGGVHAGT